METTSISTMKRKAIIIAVIVAVVLIASVAIIAAVASNQKRSTLNYPDGVVPTPTPTPQPTASPTPTATQTLTNDFTVVATVNGTQIPDPTMFDIPHGALVGTLYVVNYTITSTANQPITVTASVPPETPVTGNALISWDATTESNHYSVALGIGETKTMTMYVTLGTVGGQIPLMFTANP